ncbi:MAG: hypothetical protein MR868_06870 [Lachnospiraceae bacterium]|nr:hypothetical protein [Lachnospiraceae bacterium]
MKKTLTTLLAAAAVTCCMAFPAFAAETKAEYKEEVAPIRAELQELNDQIKPLREENKEISARFKAIRQEKKETGNLSIDKENWKQAKALRKEIRELTGESDKGKVKTLRAQAKAAVQEGSYDTALECMNQVLEVKKARLECLQEINAIWDQIDALLK